jgi:hypothetical protein
MAKFLIPYCKTNTMEKHFRSMCLLLLFCILSNLHAQKKGFEPGYIITLEGDTLLGQVKDRSSEPYVELYPRIRFRPEGKSSRKKYGPKDILGYGAGGREYVTVPLWEESAFFKFRYYLDPNANKVFLMVVKREGGLSYYRREFIYDDNNYLDFYPLFHREGDREMVRVTQGVLGLKRKRLMEYFSECDELVRALYNKELKEPDDVFNYYLVNCPETP